MNLPGSDHPRQKHLDAFTADLDAGVPRAMQRFRVEGTVVALVVDGEVAWVRGYGLADRASGTPVTAETVFQAASISKPVSAWGVMRLVEAGTLDLDAPVERYLTRWHLPPSEFDPDGVTIRRLLSHTAGLTLHGYPGFSPDHPLPTIEESLSGDTNGAGAVTLFREPGTAHRYSGGGYTLLQLVIEEVTGECFEDYMQREVLDRLGMAHSSFEWTPEIQAATATGYDYRLTYPVPNYLFTARAAAGLYTTGPDLAHFVAAAMPGPDGEPVGRGVLKPETLALMLSPAPATDGGCGLGYMLDTLPGGVRAVQHGGANVGWRGIFIALPERRQGIVVLTNGDRGGDLLPYVTCTWLDWAAGSVPEGECPLAG